MAKRRRRSKKRVIVINRPKRRRHRRNPPKRHYRKGGYTVGTKRIRRYKMNRRRSRRSYRRNPGLPTTGFIMDAAYVTGGFFGTRMLAGTILPMLPMADQPLMRIAGKGAVAWGLGFLGGKFLGQRSGQLLMLGGLVEALSDAVRTYVSPFVPALADDMGSYPTLISSYPTMSGEYSSPYAVGAGYDEAL